MIIVNVEVNNKVLHFSSVKNGTVFKCINTYYLKYSPTHAVNLSTFTEGKFLPNETVHICQSEMTIKE